MTTGEAAGEATWRERRSGEVRRLGNEVRLAVEQEVTARRRARVLGDRLERLLSSAVREALDSALVDDVDEVPQHFTRRWLEIAATCDAQAQALRDRAVVLRRAVECAQAIDTLLSDEAGDAQ